MKDSEPALKSLYLTCRKKYEDESFWIRFLQIVSPHYEPGTLHRLAASGRDASIRGLAATTLEKMGHK